MIRIHWQDEDVTVKRFILRHDNSDHYTTAIADLAQRNGVGLADDTTEPVPGDFWLGCHPVRGWGDADASQIGWASIVEVPVAVATLLARFQPEPIRDVTLEVLPIFAFDQRLQYGLS
jgi:hypothetical protein